MTKDKKQYRILVVEDNPGDFVIIEDLLTDKILLPVITQAINYSEAFDILDGDTIFDIILLDLSLPDKSGQELVTEILQVASLCPVIILTGYTDIDFSIRSVSEGISDYLLKDDLNAAMLYKSIIYAIERKKAISTLAASEKQYSDLFQLSPQPMCLYELGTFRFIQVNKAAIEHYGYSKEEFFGMTLLDLVPEEDKPATIKTIISQERQINETYAGLARNYKKNGEVIEVETFSTPIIINDKETTLVIAIDVTEKNLAEHKITKAIIKTQEDERYEIGGELHDNVCQLLAASQLTFGMLKASIIPSRTALFTQGQSYIGLALNEIRNLSHRLAPAFFDESTLQDAFKKLFETFNVDKKSKIILHYDDTVKQYPLPLELQLNLYRILQEQLRNIQKYAHADLIKVDLRIHNNKLKMSISDNGIGFDLKAIKTGIGLANMKRRTELFSGKFEIEASPGNGCSIGISIPLSAINLVNIKAGDSVIAGIQNESMPRLLKEQ